MDMMKNVELNSAAQETNALVPADNALSTTVQQPAAPAPADIETPVETTFADEKEQAPEQLSTSEEKKEEKKTKKTRKTKDCRVDHKERKITITKKASIPGTEAFKELAKAHKLYPDYEIVYRTARTSESRAITNNLTVKKMKEYIDIFYPNDKVRKNTLNTMNRLSKLYPNPLSFMRKWFRSEYPQYWTYMEELNKKAANA